MISVDGLFKKFDDLNALNDLSFEAADGAVTGIIGPNGAGKTTAFRIVYGLLAADQGQACIDGIDVAEDRLKAQSRLGVLPDVRGLYPRLTGREHIYYYGQLQGLSRAELDCRVASLGDDLGMSDFFDRRAKGYSRGQELKVALGRALVHDPHNIILDEPTNGLDVLSSRAVRELIKNKRNQGHCILLSSHVMAEVSALCDFLYIVDKGRVIAAGQPDDLRHQVGRDDLEDVFVRVLQDHA